MAWEIANGSGSLFPGSRWFGAICEGSDHIVPPSDAWAVTRGKQTEIWRPMERQLHLSIQDPSWQKYVRIIPI